jgi:hypothetical protein
VPNVNETGSCRVAMFVILGLILLLIALIVGLAGVLGNTGGAHTPTDGFSVLGYHVTGSTGDAFLYGIVVGVIAALGLALLLGSARHTALRGRAARRDLKESRRDTAILRRDRDMLRDQQATDREDEVRDDQR